MIKTFAFIACLTSTLVLAQTVPGSITFNARLTDTAGMPVMGSHALSFGLYDQATGGAAVWTENVSAASFSAEGLAYVELGAVTPLSSSALDGRRLFLEIAIDGTPMSPRLAIVSVPYAIRAGVAATATTVGSLTEGNIQRRVTGTCTSGQAVRSIDAAGGVQCEPVGVGVTGPTGPTGATGPAGPSLFGLASTRPASPAAGAFFLNSGSGNVEVFDGTAWKVFAPRMPSSCRQLLTDTPGLPDGVYTIQATHGGPPVQVNCDMTTQGGGWTQVIACLPGDNCTASGTVIMNADWFAADLGTLSTTGSYAQGRSLKGLVTGGVATTLMVRVSNVVTSRVGYITYPLNHETENYFSTDLGFWTSGPLAATVVDFTGTSTAQTLQMCHVRITPSTTTPFSRSLSGASGLSFLGNTTGVPIAVPNANCDFGPWPGQILMHRPADGLTASWGLSGPVVSWSAQQHSHKLFVR